MTTAMSNTLSPAAVGELVHAATLAPSPDNNQPWRFAYRGDRLLVYDDPARGLPSDIGSMYGLMALGAAVENICLAAGQMGYEPRVEFLAAPSSPSRGAEAGPVAAIGFTPGGTPDPLVACLATRLTNRKPYAFRAVDTGRLQVLERVLGESPDLRVDWVSDRRRIRALARLMAASDRIRFEYEPFHEELNRQLRFTPKEADQTRDGLDLRTLEVPPGTSLLLRFLRPWNRMRLLNRVGLSRLLTIPSAVSVWRSGTLGAITVGKPEGESFLNGGRVFQRLWLAVAQEGLALQPLGSLPIFLAHLEQDQARRLSEPHRRLVGRLAARFREIVPETQGRTLLMLFRLGQAGEPRFRSLRRSVEEVFDAAETLA
ncbi:MAG: hypothetical protein ACYC35_08075 [Pirellulales bacterium]